MKIPERPPTFETILKYFKDNKLDFTKLFSIQSKDAKYISYEDTKYRPIPEDLKEFGDNRIIWWAWIVLSRIHKFRELPLRASEDGVYFKFFLDNLDLQLIHKFDLNAGGTLSVSGVIPNEQQRNKYFISSLIEEAFSSSFMEGAISTRERAKKLIAESREPKDKNERMILNNYLTMQELENWKNEELSPELICKIHTKISEGTLPPDKLGKFRSKEDKDIVLGDDFGNTYHTPCDYESIPSRIKELCDFANTEFTGANFIHPIIKAIILHFMLAYIHPFCDGNGRTSRALFYWYLLKNNYWIVKFISISKIILETGNRYYMSFLNTEQDYNDLNYFIKFQLEVFDRAIKAFYEYISNKQKELIDYSSIYPKLKELNSREKNIALRIIKKPFESLEITIESHAGLNGVSWETSRKDLHNLENQKILTKRKDGKIFIYTPSQQFLDQIESRYQ